MRILLFGPYPLADHRITGGVMAVVYALAQGLARHPDIEVAVASALPGGPESVEKEGRLTIYRVGIPHLPRTRRHRSIRRKLVAVADDFRPTIIHAHGTGYYAAAALDGYWPVILTAHGVVSLEAKRSGARSFKDKLAWRYDASMEARVLRRARHAIAISPYVRQAFAAYPHLQWIDIPNPVDDRFFEIDHRPEPGRLFSPARIIPRKGVDTLIRAFATIAEVFPKATLRLAGETASLPDFARHCQKIVADAGLTDRVHFLGNLGKEALSEELGRAAGVALPARQETAPVAIEEALAAGCPVIATQVGGVPWMITHEQTGLLVPPDDVQALAGALNRLLSNNDDAVIWSQNARTSAQIYRLNAVTAATLAAYRQVLSPGAP